MFEQLTGTDKTPNKANRNPLDRRRLVDGAVRRVHTVGHMTELHHEICRMILLGMKNVEIAEKLKCTPQTVSNVRNSPIVKYRMKELANVRDAVACNFALEVKSRTARAFDIIDEVLQDETGEVPLMLRVKEANNILDRVERIEGIGSRNLHVHAHLTGADIEALKQRALDAGIASGQIANSQTNDGDKCFGQTVGAETLIEVECSES